MQFMIVEKFFILMDKAISYDIQISNTVFVDNLVNDYAINVVVNSAEIDITASSFMGNNVTRSGIFLPRNS